MNIPDLPIEQENQNMKKFASLNGDNFNKLLN